MKSGAGGTDGFRHSRKKILFAGANPAAALAIGCSPASNSTKPPQAVLDANADGNPSSTITLTGSFVVTGREPPPSLTEFRASYGGNHGTV
jgi:hypothetical protein